MTLDDCGTMNLKSASGKLIPANLTNYAWMPIAFPGVQKKSTLIGFADLSGATYTGTWAIGNIAPVDPAATLGVQYKDLNLLYGKSGSSSYTVPVIAVPEPATMALLAASAAWACSVA